jgi:hypothetical protein
MGKNQSGFIKPKLLIVEGKDDFNFMLRMLDHMGVDDVQIHEIMGVNGLGAKLGAIKKAPGFSDVQKITLMVDCDADAAAREDAIKAALASVSLVVPLAADVRAAGDPSVRYSLIPGGVNIGCLEHLLMESFAAHPTVPCLDAFLQCVNHPAKFGSNDWAKARVHCLLSTFSEAGLKIGEAAKANYFDFTHAAFQPLRDVVTDLAT